jgi:hypothetical protein
MPFDIRKKGNGFQVYNKASGKVYGTHPTESAARAQQKALYVNVPDAKPAKVSEAGVYSVSIGEGGFGTAGNNYDGDNDADFLHDKLAESVPEGAPESDFAAPPKGLYVGDAKHAALAVQAVTGGLEGNKAEKRDDPGVKTKIASAVRKFYKGAEQQYYLTWLHTGKKPDKKPAAEMHMAEIAIATPHFTMADESRFPDVPIAPGVDVARLTAGENNPRFVVRPLAIEGGVSDNNLKYTASMLDEIYQQVRDKHVPGRLGHVSEANRSWEVPPDSCLWVGVLDDPGTVFGKRTIFGKAYLYPTMPLYEMVEKRAAAGTPLSNSIWGLADLTDNDDGTVSSQSTDIESIDFVSPERAALKALGGDFVVTSEMEDAKPMDEHADAAQDLDLFKRAVASIKPDIIHEMLHEGGYAHEVAKAHMRLHETTGECPGGSFAEMFSPGQKASVCEMHLKESGPEETYGMLSEAQRAHVAECYAKEKGNTMKPVQEEVKEKESIGEMTNRLSEMEKANVEMKQQISELQKINKAHERTDFERALDATIETYFVAEMHTPRGKEVLVNLKRQMRKGSLAEMAGMENGQIKENIAVACEKVWTEDTKALTEMAYAGVAGPAAVVNAPRNPNAGNRLGIDQATGHFSSDFMKVARDAANGAVRRKGSK